MGKIIEDILFYILGAIAGIVGGFGLIYIFAPSYQDKVSVVVLVGMAIIGLLVFMIIREYTYELTMKRNNKLRDETVALITHEMRTGLTSTGWAIQDVLQNYAQYISEEDKKMLNGVVDSIHTTVMHSVNLLDVSMIDIGKLALSLEWKPLSAIDELVRETMEKYTFGARRLGITCTAQVDLDSEQQVQVDMLRLRIIIENLLENALQYTKGTQKEVKLDVHNSPTTLTITVSDTGIGIPPEEQEKIFSEFYRASNARKILSSGSGIGLYMCHQYVKAHKGTITFISKEGQGTTFTITIPLKTAADVHEFLKKI